MSDETRSTPRAPAVAAAIRSWLHAHGAIGIGLLLAIPVLALNASRYLPFIADDALISLRYAARLVDGLGLTWASGPRVEGYSNLLWTLVLAGLGALGVELVWASRALGVLCTLIAAVALVWTPRARGVTPALALLIMATTGPIAVWMIGGLEQPMIAALLAIALRAVFETLDPECEAVTNTHALRVASVAFALLCLTRPDSPLFVGMTALGVACLDCGGWRERWRRIQQLAVWPVVAVLAQTTWRRAYYGEWVPNTALVKLAWTRERMTYGLTYVSEGLAELSPLSELTAIVLVVGLYLPQTRRPSVIVVLNIAAWLTYVVFAGGDLFPARRHFVPVIVLSMFALLALGLALERRFAWRAKAAIAATALLVAGWMWRSQPTRVSMAHAIQERWEWNGQVLALALRDSFKQVSPLVAVTAAGCIPYWSELDAIDMLGLNDHYLPRHAPRDFGRGKAGHELGDARYVLSRRPDLVVFHVGTGPMFRIGRDLARAADFKHHYQALRLTLTTPRAYTGTIYVRRDSPKLGIARQTNGDTHVPGYLIQGAGPARIDRHGTLAGSMTQRDRAWIELPHPVGHAAIRVDSTPANAVTASVARKNPRRIELRTTHRSAVALERLRITPIAR